MVTKKTTKKSPEQSGPSANESVLLWACQQWIDGARAGRSQAADKILELAVRNLRAGEPLPENISQYLAELLQAIRDADKPWKVPLFKRKPGQKSADDYWSNWRAAHYYWQLTIKQGIKEAAAELQVAETFTWLKPEDVRNRWRKFKHLFPGK